MACVQFKSKMLWKVKKNPKSFESQDYVYMNWEFKKNCSSLEEYVNTKEAGNEKTEETKLKNLPRESKFESIHS